MNLLNTYKNKRVIFFVDLDETNGLGHLKRIIKFSLIFDKFEKTIISEKKIKLSNFKTISLKNFYKKKKYYNFGVIDNYNIDFKTEKKIKSKVFKLITIDDKYDRKFCCDFLINYNPLINKIKYKNKVTKKTKLLIGRDYNFLNTNHKVKINNTKTLDIFIYFGQNNRIDYIKENVLNYLKNKYIKNIYITSKYKFKFFDLNLKFRTFKNSKKLINLMSNCDIIIVSSGVIVYEALSLKKLIYTSAISSNQISNHKYLTSNNYTKDLSELKNLKLNHINKLIKLKKKNIKNFIKIILQ